MKPDYLDLLLFGALAVVTLVSVLHIRPRNIQRVAPTRRRDDAPVVIRRRNSRW